MEKRYKLNAYGEVFIIRLIPTEYALGPFAIAMECLSECGTYWEPYDVLTTYLPGARSEGHFAFVQKDKYLDFVLENKLGMPTGKTLRSGYNDYVEIEFNNVITDEEEDFNDI
jgi:hypothetical protein